MIECKAINLDLPSERHSGILKKSSTSQLT